MNVVIVEDEKEILNGMNEVLSELRDRFGQVHAFDNGEDAFQHIVRHKPDMIITDIVLPRASGLEIIERIVSKTYHPKIVQYAPRRHPEHHISVNRFVYATVLDYLCLDACVTLRLHEMPAAVHEDGDSRVVVLAGKSGLTAVRLAS